MVSGKPVDHIPLYDKRTPKAMFVALFWCD